MAPVFPLFFLFVVEGRRCQLGVAPFVALLFGWKGTKRKIGLSPWWGVQILGTPLNWALTLGPMLFVLSLRVHSIKMSSPGVRSLTSPQNGLGILTDKRRLSLPLNQSRNLESGSLRMRGSQVGVLQSIHATVFHLTHSNICICKSHICTLLRYLYIHIYIYIHIVINVLFEDVYKYVCMYII